MLVQDQLTGYFHEVPDGMMGESEFAESPDYGEVVYDGLGNPVGLLPFLPAIASALLPLAAKALPAVAGAIPGLARRFLPGVSQILPNVARAAGQAISSLAPPPAPGMPYPRPFPNTLPRPWPLGWQRPPLPYTGLGPRRMYMRCAVWPGPRGLVPASALTAQPVVPMTPAAAAAAVAAGRRRRRFRRR